jgi:hypothetical protein
MMLAAMLLAASMASAQTPDRQTRDCVAQAPSPARILMCEQEAQQRWRQRIADFDAELRTRLSGKALARYEAAQAAWRDYQEAEAAFIDLTVERRGDGAGALLAEGARSALLQIRAEQLAQHLAGLGATAGH